MKKLSEARRAFIRWVELPPSNQDAVLFIFVIGAAFIYAFAKNKLLIDMFYVAIFYLLFALFIRALATRKWQKSVDRIAVIFLLYISVTWLFTALLYWVGVGHIQIIKIFDYHYLIEDVARAIIFYLMVYLFWYEELLLWLKK